MWFQLGHVLSDMEMTYGERRLSEGYRGVSIGPRPFGHGNANAGYAVFPGDGGFQLGHVLSDMEMLKIIRKWGLGISGVSIGPRPFGHGNMRTSIPQKSEDWSGVSIGPRPFGHGNDGGR